MAVNTVAFTTAHRVPLFDACNGWSLESAPLRYSSLFLRHFVAMLSQKQQQQQNASPRPSVTIAGAGPVGCLAAVYFARAGYKVHLFEARKDSRQSGVYGGRSINLALSDRGLLALEKVGLDQTLRQTGIPMHGRMIHPPQHSAETMFTPYGKSGQYIMSISRRLLNEINLSAAENEANVEIFFEHRVKEIDTVRGTASFEGPSGTLVEMTDQTLVVGADGSHSKVRQFLMKQHRINYAQTYIESGYKELCIPAGPGSPGAFLMEKNALHIWPRYDYMMIALPNPEGDFTCTLFAPWSLLDDLDANPSKVRPFFDQMFPDASRLMPTLEEDFRTNPTSALVTGCADPFFAGKTLLLGDAANFVVPFYGQGVNSGMESVRILFEGFIQNPAFFSQSLYDACDAFCKHRKPDLDGIRELALYNYYEMRDRTASWTFRQRQRLDRFLNKLLPHSWIPLYTMVTFSPTVGYAEARHRAQKQDALLHKILVGVGVAGAGLMLAVPAIALLRHLNVQIAVTATVATPGSRQGWLMSRLPSHLQFSSK